MKKCALHPLPSLVFLLVAIGLPMWARADPPQPLTPKRAEYRIAVHCKARLLQLWRGPKLIGEYPIHTGKGGLGKKRSGDHKTPIGDYEISWMASKTSPKGHRILDKRSWCRGNEFYHGAKGPSLEKLWTKSYGGVQATVISINYPNEIERKMGYTGSCIHIHADRKLVLGALKKSFGCIHMFPRDAVELYETVDVGTPVRIHP